MNNKVIVSFLMTIPFFIQAGWEDVAINSAKELVKVITDNVDKLDGLKNGILGAGAMIGAGGMAIAAALVGNKVIDVKYQKLSPEEQVKKEEEKAKDCFETHQNGPINEFGFPSTCEDQLVAYIFAREELSNSQILPKTKDIIDASQRYSTPSP